MSLHQQADMIDLIVSRTVSVDGSTAKETWMQIEGEMVEDLRALARRLNRMAVHETRIKQLVMRGK